MGCVVVKRGGVSRYGGVYRFFYDVVVRTVTTARCVVSASVFAFFLSSSRTACNVVVAL